MDVAAVSVSGPLSDSLSPRMFVAEWCANVQFEKVRNEITVRSEWR